MTQNTANHHVTVVATAVLIGAAIAGCTAPRAESARGDAAAHLPVTVAEVVTIDVADAMDVGGVVQARATATITARVVAPVREVRVAPGDRVRQGQTLIVLAGDELAAGARAARSAAVAAEQGATAAAADREAAEASLALARASHARIAVLHAKRSATAQELDDATAAMRGAEARVTAASARALQARSAVDSAHATSDHASTTESFLSIAAPFDGTVTAKMIEPGNLASPGMPLLRLEDTSEFRLEVRVDAARSGAIRRGGSVRVFLGSDSVATPGTVTEISRALDADAHTFLVKIALPGGPNLRSGLFGKARLTATPRRALTVPSSSIVRHGQVTSVFVVDEGVARVRLVNVNDVEVLAGLVEAELVILSPPAGLKDGRRVIVGGR